MAFSVGTEACKLTSVLAPAGKSAGLVETYDPEGETAVVVRHALRNGMIPVITLIGLQAPILIGGAVIFEQIFVIPGMGLLLLEAVFQRDYPVVSGVFLVVGASVLVINLLVDMSYGLLDPRVRPS